MAKSARASVMKKNKSALRNRVFGPVEEARNERLSAKLLELASQPKGPRPEMDVDNPGEHDQDQCSKGPSQGAVTKTVSDADTKGTTEESTTTAGEDVDMDTDIGGKTKLQKSKREVQRLRAERAAKVAKKRKPQNTRVFASHAKKRKGGGRR